MRWAARHGVPVVPRGAGTGLSGGASAVDGGIVLSLERMRAVEVDPFSQVAVVEPGALNAEVKAAAAEHGLWYPPDPSSYEICSIGGNVATNAGGLCCVKYGVTRDAVMGLEVVLADGRVTTKVSGTGGARTQALWLAGDRLFLCPEGRHGSCWLTMLEARGPALRLLGGEDFQHHDWRGAWPVANPFTTAYAQQQLIHPVVAGRLFVRGGDGLYCYDLRAP